MQAHRSEGSQMSRLDELLAAIDAGDDQAIDRLGWAEPWDLLATANAPRQICPLSDLRPYVKMLADFEPEEVVAAIKACAGEWRPSAAKLRGWLNGRRAERAQRIHTGGGGPRRDGTTEALSAVAAAWREGAEPCSCGAWSPQWNRDAAWVLHCPTCDGLEPGQLHAAEDAGLLGEAA